MRSNRVKLITSAVLLFSLILLQACSSFYITGSEKTTATITADSRTLKNQLTDHNISLQAIGLANKAPYQYQMRVNAIAYNGKILLMGQTENNQLSQDFELKIKNLNKKSVIHNQIRIRPLLTFTQVNNDTWITTKVKSSMLTESRLNGANISVFTEAQEVFLLGAVTQDQGNIAAEVARNITNVKSVIKAFEYIPNDTTKNNLAN